MATSTSINPARGVVSHVSISLRSSIDRHHTCPVIVRRRRGSKTTECALPEQCVLRCVSFRSCAGTRPAAEEVIARRHRSHLPVGGCVPGERRVRTVDVSRRGDEDVLLLSLLLAAQRQSSLGGWCDSRRRSAASTSSPFYSPPCRSRPLGTDANDYLRHDRKMRLICAAAGGKKSSLSSSEKTKRGGGGGGRGYGGGTSSRGFGSKGQNKGSSVDSAALLRRSEEQYREILASSLHEEGEVREFVICARFKQDEARGNVSVTKQSSQDRLDDWLPIAELALVSDEEASVAVPKVLPFICRELAECVGKGCPSLRSIPRDRLEYAFESADEFYRHVMEDVGGFPSGESVASDREENPYEVLGLANNASQEEVKAAYRALAAVHHPDRNLGEENQKVAEERFKRVTKAYQKLKRSQRPSGQGMIEDSSALLYETLGGGSRLGLSDAIEVTSVSKDGEMPSSILAAVRRLDAEITASVVMAMRTRTNGSRASVAT